MDLLEQIKEKVNQKLNQRHSEIIISYFQVLIKNHNEFCGCNYCQELKYYVQLKKYKSSFNRRYYNYDGFDEKLEREFMNNYRILDNKIKELKINKDKLKQLN